VCPKDTHLQSPICRGLTEYKRIVLDPYIIPPIQAVLAHPSVSPHIERAKPYVHRAVEITTPILLRTQQEWNLHVVPQWERRIVPKWNNRVVPKWNKYIVPHWDRQVAPRIQLVQSKLDPYRLRVTQEYEQRILPHAQVAIYNLQRWQRQAGPYVLLAVSKTQDGYYAAKPYAVPLAKRCGHLLQQFALFLRGHRQKFVDPHVAKMWEKVKELSRVRQVIHDATPERESLSPDTLFTILETTGYETTVSSAHSPTSAYDVIPTAEETDVAHSPSSLSASETTEVFPHSTFVEPTFSPVPEPATSTQLAGSPTGAESFLGTESVHAESLHESEPPTSGAPAFVEELDAEKSSVSVAATPEPSSSAPPAADEPTNPPASVTPSKITIAAASASVPPAKSRADDEIDFDAFYAELGLDEPLGNLGDSEESSVPSSPAETEEESAERLRLKAEETARKRTDIEARQTKWEAELQAQMEHSTSQLHSRLGNLRATAASELASSADVRNSIEELVNEAEKYLKGAEIYLKNLKGEGPRSDEKLALWDRVAERVNDKFNEHLLATEGVVNTWYRIVLDKELQEVRKEQ
jgi:ribosomal protein S30